MMVLIELSPSYCGQAFQNSTGEARHVYIPRTFPFHLSKSLVPVNFLSIRTHSFSTDCLLFAHIPHFSPVQEDSIERITPSDDVPYRLYFIFSRNHDAENQKSIEKKPQKCQKCANK